MLFALHHDRFPLRRWMLIVLAVSLHLSPLARPARGPVRGQALKVREPGTVASTVAAPDYREEIINSTSGESMVHVASICELPGGRLAAAWYRGTREGHGDVGIFLSVRAADEAGEWSPPREIVNRESAAAELRRYVKKVGNAVLFADASGALWLVYVSVSAGGWSGSSLNLKRSFDEGRTWTPSRQLRLSPFFNVSELVKNKPAELEDHAWALPIYHEAWGKFSELLWLREMPGGVSVAKTRLFGGRTAFQPALASVSSNEVVALNRSALNAAAIMSSHSTNGGLSWSPPRATTLPNPDSGLDALRLFDGRTLLVFNDSATSRDNLRLALSEDNGRTWSRWATVTQETGAEFSYPFLIQSTDGNVHLVYTSQRRAIKYVRFNPAWLDARPPFSKNEP